MTRQAMPRPAEYLPGGGRRAAVAFNRWAREGPDVLERVTLGGSDRWGTPTFGLRIRA